MDLNQRPQCIFWSFNTLMIKITREERRVRTNIVVRTDRTKFRPIRTFPLSARCRQKETLMKFAKQERCICWVRLAASQAGALARSSELLGSIAFVLWFTCFWRSHSLSTTYYIQCMTSWVGPPALRLRTWKSLNRNLEFSQTKPIKKQSTDMKLTEW